MLLRLHVAPPETTVEIVSAQGVGISTFCELVVGATVETPLALPILETDEAFYLPVRVCRKTYHEFASFHPLDIFGADTNTASTVAAAP